MMTAQLLSDESVRQKKDSRYCFSPSHLSNCVMLLNHLKTSN